nr:hypothetical protein GCM10020185_49640 [Pseudomonas brassicacearum subsp. brassicacearum]
MIGVFGLTLALAVVGYVFIPKGFFPVQDTGLVLGTSEAAADVSFPDMVAKHKALADIVAADPAVQTFSHSVGVSGNNQTIANGRFWIALKPRGERDVSASGFIDRIRPQLLKIPGVVLYLRAGQDINLSSGPSRAQYQYVLKSNDGPSLNAWTQKNSPTSCVATRRSVTSPTTCNWAAASPTSTSTAARRRASASPPPMSTRPCTTPSANGRSMNSRPRPTSTT